MEYRFRSVCVKKLAKSFSSELIDKIKEQSFSPSENEDGFILLESLNDELHFQYLRKVNFIYGDFQGEFIKKKGEAIKECNFKIDLSNMLLFIYAGKSQSNFLVRKLENICGNFLVPVDIEFVKILDLMEKTTYISRMDQVEINNFSFSGSLVGKYIVNVYDYGLFKDLLEKHRTDLSRVTLSLENYQGDVTVINISKDGSFLFRSYSDTNSQILLYLLTNLL